MTDQKAGRTGIIGGSGLYDIEGIEVIDSLSIETPFGKPSDDLLLARIGEHEVVFLPRHGRGHRLPPPQNQLPRQHLRHESGRGKPYYFNFRRRFIA